jgi:hypothetical protein
MSVPLHSRLIPAVLALTAGLAPVLPAQTPGGAHYLKAGESRRAEDILEGAFKRRFEALNAAGQDRALRWMEGFNLPGEDLPHLHLDEAGGIYYACTFRHAGGGLPDASEPAPEEDPPVVAQAAVPVSPFPSHLLFHSRPGAPNVIFLDFDGAAVSGTVWNSGGNTLQALPFDTDGTPGSFSDAEQLAIKRIWMRVAEDYAPFNVDVTTEAPASFGTRVCQVLITRNTDANGVNNPSSGAGGVAYVNVYARSDYAFYRPAWVYHNNLSQREDNIAEAASHEAGHNFGLSHDSTTANPDGYYGGHGSGDTSWGPIMGTGYGRNMSQWSKGEYTNANNQEDDLALLASDLGYRTDDAGNTPASPRALTILNSTTIAVTSVDADPGNTNPANKGVIERNTDVDVWSFTTGTGLLNIRVDPFLSAANTRGGNLDLLVELYDGTGTLVASANPAANTYAVLSANVVAGAHTLHVRNTGVGTPTAASPSGYTSYGSLGQYFISGTIPNNSGIIVPPQATAALAELTAVGVAAHPFTVTYTDDVAVDVTSLDGSDLRITGPGGYSRLATFVSVDNLTPGTPRVATYSAPAPDGTSWKPSDNGTYQVELLANHVRDTEGAFAAPTVLGSFQVTVPMTLYAADMSVNPDWTFTGPTSNGWAYGKPAGNNSDPSSGYTGNNVVGYNLNGAYENRLSTAYATTPTFDCSQVTSVTLQFRRWLGLRQNDTARVQVSVNGTTWSTVWSSSANINDTSWQLVTFDLSSTAAGQSAVRLRWSLASNNTQTRCGWNIDDVFVLGGGVPPDSQPPTATLSANAVVTAGNPSHAFTLTLTDNQAVAVASLDAADVQVTAPDGTTPLPVFFSGVDENEDGTPRLATYSVDAPGGTWNSADNGTYTVTLLADQITDPTGNAATGSVLGSFQVAIPVWTVTVEAIPDAGGSVTGGGSYDQGDTATLTAQPATYYAFAGWADDPGVTNAVRQILVTTHRHLQADFALLRTANTGVPHLWLVEQGITENFDDASLSLGANGLPLWQSYVAGLNPQDPADTLRVDAAPSPRDPASRHLAWRTVEGRLYTLLRADKLGDSFLPVSGATLLPATVNAFEDPEPVGTTGPYYRLEVVWPGAP